MSNIAISVENLGKKYQIGELERYYTIRDSLTHLLNYPLRLLNKKEIKEKEKEFIWALKDISFEVQHGDIVGIIGRNGAGKSTLLKILSRITSPTEGLVKLNGRVGSLLEVGTGFHPELTGRENIFLNGSILGMSKKEIERKFDEIVDFAEIEKFLDTPVKRYSSGMYVRLAFAVAAHMEPEILVVDEVLAVGDIQFQKKCLGKMDDVSKEGRTVLFVSHNLQSIRSLCKYCILLQNGKLIERGKYRHVIEHYIKGEMIKNTYYRNDKCTNGIKIIEAILSKDRNEISINTKINSDRRTKISIDIRLSDQNFNPIGFGSLGSLDEENLVEVSEGENNYSFSFNIDKLAYGKYFLGLDLTHPKVQYFDRLNDCLVFEIENNQRNAASQVFSQDWGYGCMEIPLNKKNS